MKSISATEARKKIHKLIDEIARNHMPVKITGKRNNAVLVSEEDWHSIQETLNLSSIPGMQQSIIEGLEEDLGNCDEKPGW